MNKRDSSVLHGNMKCTFFCNYFSGGIIFYKLSIRLTNSFIAVQFCRICCKTKDNHLARIHVFRIPHWIKLYLEKLKTFLEVFSFIIMCYAVCVICNLERIFIDAAVYNFYFASICMSSVFVGIFYHQSLYEHRCKRKPLLQKGNNRKWGKGNFL